MPKGPQGQKRPVDAIGAAVKSMRILTGEEGDDTRAPKPAKAKKTSSAKKDRR